MKKLIALTALVGLMAVGCASRENRGGAYDQSNPQYGSGSSSSMNTAPGDNTGTSDINNNNASQPGTTGNNSDTNTNGSTPNSSSNPSSTPNTTSH